MLQAKSAFWDKLYDEKATKRVRAKTKSVKKNKKKSTASDLFNLDEDDDDSEVDLDLLALFSSILLTLIAIRMTRKPAKRVMTR